MNRTGRALDRARADDLLVARGLAKSRSQARALIMAAKVRSGERLIDKAGTMLSLDEPLSLVAAPRFASRGGEKLDHALSAFDIDVASLVCADFGASTGGFTDVLLQRGARRIYAIDVGYGQLDYRLRSDERVVVMERTNVRYLDALPEPIDLVVIDVSFISLRLVLPAAKRVLRPAGSCLALVKPQFEAGRAEVGKGGVVRDARTHARVLREVGGAAVELGFDPGGLVRSPITGPAGNVEFIMLLRGEPGPPVDLERQIRAVVEVNDREQ